MSGQLKEVRQRIASVTSTQQITNAMKMVSAAKLRRAQNAILDMRPYAQKLQGVLSNIISAESSDLKIALAEEREMEKVIMVVITSDRGTCGAYNANVIKKAVEKINSSYLKQKESGNLSVLTIGKKGYDYFKRHNYTIIDEFMSLLTQISFEEVKKVADFLQKAYLNKEVDKVELVYSQFQNAVVQNFITEDYLPIPKKEKIESEEAKEMETDFLFEPSKEELIENLMPIILNTQIYKAVLDANASEHGARMTAMDKATENANELIRELKISYNRARQAAITTELTEIVSGAAALNG